jgi:hypothetical protein
MDELEDARTTRRSPRSESSRVRENPLRAHAERHLPEAEHPVLMLWIEGSGFEEIAAELGLPNADVARKQLRTVIAVLRRKFAGDAW